MSMFSRIEADPLLWRRVGPWSYQRRNAPILDVANAAFDSIEKLHLDVNPNYDEVVGRAVAGAMLAVSHFVSTHPDAASDTCRRVARYFGSQRFEVACNTLRVFQGPPFNQYSIFVLDELVETASCESPPASPVDMTILGFAFLVLYDLDPQLVNRPQLVRARNECVHGLQTWPSQGSSDSRNRSRQLAIQMMRYVQQGK